MSVGGLPILTYHALDSSGGVISTDPSWFAESMAALHASGWRAIDLADWIALGRPRLDRTFALTFDDGLRSILLAADTLARYCFPATVFLVTDYLGLTNAWPGQPGWVREAPLLSWSQLPSLRSAGFRFAAHTRTHPRLDRLDGPALDSELRGSRDEIEQRLGLSCPLFAYPYGIAPPLARRAAVCSFSAAFGTRLGIASGPEDLFALSRIDAYYLRTPSALDRLISGRWQGWLALRRALRGARRASAALVGG